MVDRLDAVLRTWRAGEPYADLPDHPDVLAARSALEQVRESAEEARLLGLLGLGEHSAVLASTEQSTSRFPLRENLWAIHALALTRAGRQADALDALRTVRAVLADELGLDPGPQLRELEGAILRQADVLGRARAPAGGGLASAHHRPECHSARGRRGPDGSTGLRPGRPSKPCAGRARGPAPGRDGSPRAAAG